MADRLSGRHLAPLEPSELPGDCGDDQVLGVLTGGQPTEATAQPQLGRPGRATTWGPGPAATLGQGGPNRGPLLVCPGRLGQLSAQGGVAGLDDVATAGSSCRWHTPRGPGRKVRERGRPREAAPVTDLASQPQRPS